MGRRSRDTSTSLASPATVRLRALLSLGMVVGLGAVGTLAAWSDQATATATFSAGTLDLTLNAEADDAVDFTSLTMSNMYPGLSKAAVLSVANPGSLPFTYNFSATAVDNSGNTASLSSSLTLSVAPGGLAADGKTCANSPLALTSGSLKGSALSTPRPLASGVSEQLCITVGLPSAATNDLQAMGTTATFTFTADQVK